MPRVQTILVGVALGLGTGCDDQLFPECPPGFSLASAELATTGSCVFDEERVLDLVRTFDQGELVRINDHSFEQIYGTPFRRNLWVTPVDLGDATARTAADLYATVDPDAPTPLAAAFPVGTVIVHEAVDREEGHGVQVKREPGWLGPDGRGWWFAKVYDDGTYDVNACSPCQTCHNEASLPLTDGLIGVREHAPRG